jgi:glycosyltransferase involved in cell wall biosynthesis
MAYKKHKMRIGLIARADRTGLGIQSLEFFRNIPNVKALVIDMSDMVQSANYVSTLIPFKEWYPGAKVIKIKPPHHMVGSIDIEVIRDFIKDIDILFAIETPYDYRFFSEASSIGVKTVLQFNYEFLDYPSHLPRPDLFAAPSQWHFDAAPHPKIYLPVPVNTVKFKQLYQPKTFVHIAGRPAIHDRNGTQVLLDALWRVKNPIKVVIKGQMPVAINYQIKDHINIEYDFENKQNYYDNYTGGVLVMPRKYGGLCLPFNEAMAAAMPIITTDISPNNLWLPKEWLVPADYRFTFDSKRKVEVFHADVDALAEKIDQFCDDDFYWKQGEKAIIISNGISWQSLAPLYENTFRNLLVKS